MIQPRTILILTTVPDTATADRLASLLVESRLAACVNILPGVRSVYRWQGTVERADELQLIIKTASDGYRAVEEAIRAHHPYETPEIIALPIAQGLPAYLQWIVEESSGSEPLYV